MTRAFMVTEPKGEERRTGSPSRISRAAARDAARLLGISRTTLWRRMKELGL